MPIPNILTVLLLLVQCLLLAQPAVKIPAVYSNLRFDSLGNLKGIQPDGKELDLYRRAAKYTLQGVSPKAIGEKEGLRLHFTNENLRGGRLIYGLIPYGEHRYPMSVLRFTSQIDSTGAAFLAIKNEITEGLDHTGWQKKGFGVIGFRLLDAKGNMVFEGKQAFAVTTKGFEARPTVVRGPFVANQTAESVVIWYETSEPVVSALKTSVATDTFFSSNPHTRHEIPLTGLQPSTQYHYEVFCDQTVLPFHFTTAPAVGSRQDFTFAYASDSRSGYGGGERDIYGANAQIMQRIGALSIRERAGFVQFTGDMVGGYLSEPDEMRLQFANWMHAIEPFWHYLPFNVGVGNHESLGWAAGERGWVAIDGFPYETHSGEAVFAAAFVNPQNGPQSEDGTKFDPDPYRRGDFPPYSETVFHYTYANTAMVVLNSNYWFAPMLKRSQKLGGNLHGYVMDEQLRWLKSTLADFEKDTAIDHVFITIHTPLFPNGGHRGDCMWYDGDNQHRPWVAGKPVEKGIIERRDEILDLCANGSSKVIGFLCGDEHNYNRMLVSENLPRYPENWDKPRVKLNRPLWQIINGAAGAPFYGKQKLPWSAAVEGFTVQNALCLFDISGKKIRLRVVNPDTLEEIDTVDLR